MRTNGLRAMLLEEAQARLKTELNLVDDLESGLRDTVANALVDSQHGAERISAIMKAIGRSYGEVAQECSSLFIKYDLYLQGLKLTEYVVRAVTEHT